MLELLPTSKPSENIFAKDPIDSIQDFFSENCTAPGQKCKGITLNDFEKWKKLVLHYEENDLKLAIESFNERW